MRVTHPFHPLSGRKFPCVGERCTPYGKRVLLKVDDTVVCSVPRQWTDLVGLDPEIVLGGCRAIVRVGDLIERERLIRARAAGKTR